MAVSCPADTPNDVHKQLRLSQLQVKDQACVQQPGRPRKYRLENEGRLDVTGCQAQDSQPVQVRSGEMPGSSVAWLPASVEMSMSKRGDEHPVGMSRPTSPQHEVKLAASSFNPRMSCGPRRSRACA